MSAIDEIYKVIPEGFCKGLCYQSCGPIAYSEEEASRMLSEGITPPVADPKTLVCDKLKDKRCTIYQSRPYVCRVYGCTTFLMCHFGCKPSRVIDLKESRKHMEALGKIRMPKVPWRP